LNGKYKLLKLTSRATKISMPDVKIIDTTHKDKDFLEKINSDNFFDLINKLRIKFLSTELIYEIGYCLERKESVILLQNRRGYHFYIECLNCNSVETCIRCTIPLTYHKINNNLICHYCGYTKQMIQKCSQCGSSSLVQKGAGTERVEEELKKLFPSAIIERLDSDIVTSKNKYQQILKDFYDKKIDVLVGTQMISKGLDFPEVTLVGVVNADIGLLIPDFRASEKTFQILTQVAGRSGRSEKHGKVLIQTNHPDYELFKSVSSQNYKHFYDNEIKLRQSANFPPYSRLVLIEINSENIKLAESKIKEIYNLIKKSDSKKILDIYPPAQPLFFKLKNHYRYHILVKSPKSKDLSGSYTLSILKTLTEYSKKNFNSKIKITIDVDVINLL
jgi:primosomal protein N' (replication factor Y)